MASVTGAATVLEPQVDVVPTGTESALRDILLWDALMRIQNGDMKRITWSDVEGCDALRTEYGPLSERLCKQAASVERIRGTMAWQPAIETTIAGLPKWPVVCAVRKHPGLSDLAAYLCDGAHVGLSTAFVQCYSRAATGGALPEAASTSSTHDMAARVLEVGKKWGITGGMSGMKPLLGMSTSRLVAIMQDMVQAVRGER